MNDWVIDWLNDWMNDWQSDRPTKRVACRTMRLWFKTLKSVSEIKSILIRHSNQLSSAQLNSIRFDATQLDSHSHSCVSQCACVGSAASGSWLKTKPPQALKTLNKSIDITNTPTCIDTNWNECTRIVPLPASRTSVLIPLVVVLLA